MNDPVQGAIPGLLRRGGRRAIVWGFVDQSFSSATNFGLSLIAGRLLGPAGLGHVFLGFSAYLVVAALARQLVIEPLIATSSARADEGHRTAAQALTTILVGASVASAGMALLGIVIPGLLGQACLLFTPWIVPALVQETWRSVLFRDGRSSAAAANDAVWLAAMAIAVPAAWSIGSAWAIVAAWGAGALAGAALGFAQTKLRPAGFRDAWAWWRTDAMPFGKWNAGAGLITAIGSNATAFVVTGILGSKALGGLRAAQSIFAPLTLIQPAISLPGLPAVTRARATGAPAARRLALRLSAIAVGAVTVYVGILSLGGTRLLPALFGDAFVEYVELIWPTAAGQAFLAVSTGFLILLKAERRGPTLLANRTLGTVVTLLAVGLLGWRYGLLGAAWGGAVGSFSSMLFLAVSATRSPSTSGTTASEGPTIWT